MNYDGGKNGEGVYQAIINQMPPHRVYIESFLGSAAVMRRKRPAEINIGIEIDPATISAVKPLLTAVDVIKGSAVDLLPTLPAGADVLVYADPPYLRDVRSCKRQLYRYEFWSIEEHTALLQLAKTSPSMWIISGYEHPLYKKMLSDWRTVKFLSPTRSGMREETLWCNFQDPVELHDYSFLGSNNTERQRIKRKKERWKNRLSKMTALERMAVLSAIRDLAQTNSSARPAA